MKRNKKIISLILAVILLISSSVIVQADSISISAELLLTGLNDASVTQAVKNYFEKRANYLLGVSETLDGTVIGIVNDEASHLEQYAHEGITLTGCTYQIDSVDCYDACAEVTVTETVAYTQNGTAKTEEVVHNLNVYLDCNDTPIVAADAYIERCSDFASCSYVMPITQTFAVSLTGGSGCCAVEIALGEVGYSVSEGGTSKYGTGAWCAKFVIWCARQAEVTSAIIPYEPDCDNMRDYFIEQGLYYDSKAYGGTYTPQVGDIYFKGVPTDASHVGYVVSVESGVFWVVDGNCNNSVRNHYEALTSSDVLGFAHPNYVTSGHTASEYEVDSTTHSGTCNNCGCEFEEEHYGGNTYYTSTTQHWKICEICDSVFGKVAHTMVRVGSTSTEKCSVCGYTGVNAVV